MRLTVLGSSLDLMSGSSGEASTGSSVELYSSQDDDEANLTAAASSFIKLFSGPFGERLNLPDGYCIDDDDLVGWWVYIRGESGKCYKVLVERGERSLIFKDGWWLVPVYERINEGDIGFFERLSANNFKLNMYNEVGLRKLVAAAHTQGPLNDARAWRSDD